MARQRRAEPYLLSGFRHVLSSCWACRRPRAARLLRAPSSTLSILNSSSLWPVSRAATTHRGRFPLPDHVSDGASGLQYLGRTFGYLRRGARLAVDSRWALPGSLMNSTLFNFAKRSSNSRFSVAILFDSILVSFSWSSQSSSNCIAARSVLRIAFS
jgi:hypothetical protein